MRAHGMRTETFKAFETWADVLAHVAKSGPAGMVYYLAPMDIRPTFVTIARRFKNGKLRIEPAAHYAGSFTADAGHLSRFRYRTEE